LTSADIAGFIQLRASRQEDHFPEVRLAAFAQGAAYGRNRLDRQGYESGIPERGR
jgi:hypothetical protein